MGSHVNQPGCAFAAISIFFMKGSRVKGSKICAKMSIFWQFMTPNIESLTKNTLWGKLSYRKIWKCVIFQKKNMREQTQTKNSLKVIFWEFVMSKIPEKCNFWWKKNACGMPAQTKIAFKHISEYSRPNSDQIPYKIIYFYMKNHENWEFSIKEYIFF